MVAMVLASMATTGNYGSAFYYDYVSGDSGLCVSPQPIDIKGY